MSVDNKQKELVDALAQAIVNAGSQKEEVKNTANLETGLENELNEKFAINQLQGKYYSQNIEGFEGTSIPSKIIKIRDVDIKSKRIALPHVQAYVVDGVAIIYTWTKDNYQKGVQVMGSLVPLVEAKLDSLNTNQDYTHNREELEKVNSIPNM